MIHIDDSDLDGKVRELLPQIERGDVLIITRDGKPVAKIVREESSEKVEPQGPFASEEVIAQRKEALEFFREFRKTHSLGGLTYRELIDDGRKY